MILFSHYVYQSSSNSIHFSMWIRAHEVPLIYRNIYIRAHEILLITPCESELMKFYSFIAICITELVKFYSFINVNQSSWNSIHIPHNVYQCSRISIRFLSCIAIYTHLFSEVLTTKKSFKLNKRKWMGSYPNLFVIVERLGVICWVCRPMSGSLPLYMVTAI